MDVVGVVDVWVLLVGFVVVWFFLLVIGGVRIDSRLIQV